MGQVCSRRLLESFTLKLEKDKRMALRNIVKGKRVKMRSKWGVFRIPFSGRFWSATSNRWVIIPKVNLKKKKVKGTQCDSVCLPYSSDKIFLLENEQKRKDGFIKR
jgi:hypothetical protein